MHTIGIIGRGFSGTMAAVQLIEHATAPIKLVLIDTDQNAIRGIAYNSPSKSYLLNVPVSGMSAFSDQPDHLLDWVMEEEEYKEKERNEVRQIFLPRYKYGEYLISIWNEALKKSKYKNIQVEEYDSYVSDLNKSQYGWSLTLSTGPFLEVDTCIIASGNQEPRHPGVPEDDYINHPAYVRNPWTADTLSGINNDHPVFILGNSLTMVDTLIGLTEKKFTNRIITLSPKGFIMLPHENKTVDYDGFTEEFEISDSIYDLIRKFNRHKRILAANSISILPLIDSIRPYTQEIWMRLTLNEKRFFMSRLRNLWNAARHRIPAHIHEFISRLKEIEQLETVSGNLLHVFTEADLLKVEWWNKKTKAVEGMLVSKLINCTGPETNFLMIPDHFLTKAFQNGLVGQESLKIGVTANGRTFNVIDRNGAEHNNLFVLGPYLKGVLWETTAVSEIREQASELAKQILGALKNLIHH